MPAREKIFAERSLGFRAVFCFYNALEREFTGDDFLQRDVGKRSARGSFNKRTMTKPELTDASGNDVDQQLLVRDHLSCFLQELSGHISQGTEGAGRFRREL